MLHYLTSGVLKKNERNKVQLFKQLMVCTLLEESFRESYHPFAVLIGRPIGSWLLITETAPIANHFLGVFETPLANNSSMISNSTGCAKEDLNSTVIRLEEDNLTTLFTIVCSTLAVLAISIFIFWKVSDKPASKRSSGGETKPEVVLIKGFGSAYIIYFIKMTLSIRKMTPFVRRKDFGISFVFIYDWMCWSWSDLHSISFHLCSANPAT